MHKESLRDVLDYEISEVRVTIIRELQRLSVAGKTYENLKSGETLIIPYWAASTLVEAGIAQYSDRLLDSAIVAQLAWRERRSVTELTELPPKFYSEARRLIRRLRESQPEQIRMVEGNLKDIVSMRISKLLSYASKGIPINRIKNIVDEEISLYLEVKKLLEAWLHGLEIMGDGDG
ncbi:MAG: hypothetical protein QXX16_03830 [Nitrososphaerota archaeon]